MRVEGWLRDLWQDIIDQPRAIRAHTTELGRASRLVQEVGAKAAVPPVFTGMATSLYAWRAAEWAIQRRGLPGPWVVDTAELLDYGPPVNRDPRPLFVISRSGESAEVTRLVQALDGRRLVVAITETPDSLLARRAQYVLAFRADERAFQNTKSFILSLAYALACAQGLGADLGDPPSVWAEEAAVAVERLVQTGVDTDAVSATLASCTAVLVVGRGRMSGVVQQVALDLQESLHMAAIPVTGGLFRHGPVELTTRRDVGTLLFIPDDEAAPLGLGILEELRGRSAPVAALVAETIPVEPGVPVVRVPRVRSALHPMVFAVAMQLLNLQLLQLRGADCATPRLVEKVTRRE
ncbi:MAG: SIS domain-containing protein [Firmicutes bacterium]|nr:SIS domain-containing protein [Bacillota bacterium]